MRKLISTLTIMTTIATASWAQEKQNYKEDVVSLDSEIINVSTDELWEIIGPGFENAGVWSTAVDHAVGNGEGQFEGATCNERLCDLNAKGFSSIKEEITLFDGKNKTLGFDVTEGTPGFVKKVSSLWEVIYIGPSQSKLRITTTIHSSKFMGTLMGGLLRSNLKKVMPTITSDLKVYAETGDVSEEKRARMAKLAKKNKSVAQR